MCILKLSIFLWDRFLFQQLNIALSTYINFSERDNPASFTLIPLLCLQEEFTMHWLACAKNSLSFLTMDKAILIQNLRGCISFPFPGNSTRRPAKLNFNIVHRKTEHECILIWSFPHYLSREFIWDFHHQEAKYCCIWIEGNKNLLDNA